MDNELIFPIAEVDTDAGDAETLGCCDVNGVPSAISTCTGKVVCASGDATLFSGSDVSCMSLKLVF